MFRVENRKKNKITGSTNIPTNKTCPDCKTKLFQPTSNGNVLLCVSCYELYHLKEQEETAKGQRKIATPKEVY